MDRLSEKSEVLKVVSCFTAVSNGKTTNTLNDLEEFGSGPTFIRAGIWFQRCLKAHFLPRVFCKEQKVGQSVEKSVGNPVPGLVGVFRNSLWKLALE